MERFNSLKRNTKERIDYIKAGHQEKQLRNTLATSSSTILTIFTGIEYAFGDERKALALAGITGILLTSVIYDSYLRGKEKVKTKTTQDKNE